MKLLNFLVPTLLAVLSGCGGSSGNSPSADTSGQLVHTKIFGGVETAQALAPQVVRIDLTLEGGRGVCSGTIIGSSAVLTTTHCFIDPGLQAVTVNVLGRDVGVRDLLVAPGFGAQPPALFNDLSILVTSEPLGIPPLPVAANLEIQPLIDLLVMGYGQNENGVFGVLRAGTINPDWITENHIIDEVAGGQNTCPGDSGGPAIAMFADAGGNTIPGIVGLTSTGTGSECTNVETAYYTNLQSPALAAFIAANVPDAIIF